MHFTVTAEIEILHNRFPRHIHRCMFWRCCCFPQVRHEDEGKCLSLLFFSLRLSHTPPTPQSRYLSMAGTDKGSSFFIIESHPFRITIKHRGPRPGELIR